MPITINGSGTITGLSAGGLPDGSVTAADLANPLTSATITTATVTTLSDGTNSTSSTNCIQGSAKAWVNWVGSTGTVQASYNVSSVTRVGTGNYNVNFTTAFADTKYVVCGFAEWATGVSATAGLVIGGDSRKTTTSCGALGIIYPSGSTYDPGTAGIAVFR